MIYNKKWLYTEDLQELTVTFPKSINDGLSIFCDDCNEEFKLWFNKLKKEEKEILRKEYLSSIYQ